MILIVGLGNPGKKYEKTRHNLGFLAVEEFASKNDFPDFKSSKKLDSLVSEGTLNEEKIILVQPQTFMNLSGKAVKLLTSKFKIQNFNLWVIHDDIDLPLGKIKIVKNRGSAGHNGVQSVINELKTKDFFRFRLGVATPELDKKDAEKLVLEKFSKKDEKILNEAIKKTVEALDLALKEGMEKAMSEFNK